MISIDDLDNLLERVSNTVRDLPGAVELYLFGSAADPAIVDPYSDLDLQVVTNDYDLSLKAWPLILNRVGKIKLAYTLRTDPQESAYWIAFENESPYHKVDIGLCDQRYEQGFHQQVKKKVLLWQQPAKTEQMIIPASDAYLPQPGTAPCFLLGELLSSVRYAKARKRGQHLTCWRFVSAKLNALLRCYRWDGDPRRFPETSLSTWDYSALDRAMPESERLALFNQVNLHSPDEMDQTLIHLTRKIADHICSFDLYGETTAKSILQDYLSFIENELNCRDE